jgi:nitrogen fixation protein NifU and related proteins
MQDLDQVVKELQQQILEDTGQHFSAAVIDHLLRPRNPGVMEAPDGYAKITGPCGDTMQIFVKIREDEVVEASFMTDGCGTTVVSASMAVELLTGRSLEESLALDQALILQRLGGLPRESQHCALLAANTARAAIEDYTSKRSSPSTRG